MSTTNNKGETIGTNSVATPFTVYGDPATFGARMRRKCDPLKTQSRLKKLLVASLLQTLERIEKEIEHGIDRWYVFYNETNIDELATRLREYNLVVEKLVGTSLVVTLPRVMQ